ncbi:MAG: 1-acyl-sn-glycerol-3-phosphate acyltransferase [Phycisphaeraceae bacterium]|nr:MAG: 1-acyl-sn-glycerol-3-phosphate acyltransferase [Phycisphaeraceae bacterium]
MAEPIAIILSLVFALGVLVLIGLFGRSIFKNPRGDFETGFAYFVGRLYVRVVHLVRIRGRKRIPSEASPGPLIVVCNHTAGVDPILVQASCPFFIRWVMAQDMRDARLEWFWKWWDVIFVDRTRPDSVGIRAALRHLHNGGVIGIFPEGGLERPARQILPFQHGVGMLIKKGGARVLTATIEGTPQYDPAWASLWHPSRSIVHFRELIDYGQNSKTAGEIAQDLHRRFMNYTSWPANDTMPAIEDTPGHGKKGRPVPAH